MAKLTRYQDIRNSTKIESRVGFAGATVVGPIRKCNRGTNLVECVLPQSHKHETRYNSLAM